MNITPYKIKMRKAKGQKRKKREKMGQILSVKWCWHWHTARYSTTDHCIQESVKRIFSSGLFWAVGAAEKKELNCYKYATFEVSFLMFSWPNFFLNCWNKCVIHRGPESMISGTLSWDICNPCQSSNGSTFIPIRWMHQFLDCRKT